MMVPVGFKKPSREADQPMEPRTIWPSWTGLNGKTLWDWLLLISALAVPVLIGSAGLWFTWQQERHQQEIEDQRSQDTAMQAYLDNMSTLLIDEHGTQLRKLDPDAEVLDLLQARTETVFAILDRPRQVSIVQFLARAQLILKDSPIVTLERVNLEGVDLTGLNLSNTSFEQASLAQSELPEANLKGANFTAADLSEADLTGANLKGANFTAADLLEANLTGAKLEGAVFTDARLIKATVTAEQLHTARSLENALMPDGQEYEDWLKDHPPPLRTPTTTAPHVKTAQASSPKMTLASSHHRNRKTESKKDCGWKGENSGSSQRLPGQTSEKPDSTQLGQ